MPTRSFLTLATALILCAPLAPAVTLSFDTGSGLTLFETSTGAPLQGYLHAGYYDSNPVGLNSADLRDNFVTWATHPTQSGATNGYFGNDDFLNTSLGAASGKSLYLMVTDTGDVNSATEIAVMTNTDLSSWKFPSSDVGLTDAVTFDHITGGAANAVLLAGTELPAAAVRPASPAIRLNAIPEPSTSLLALLGIAGLMRRRR